jgi:glycosyltransferase 2 family protein
MKKWLLLALKLALTVACLCWALHGTDVKGSILARPSQLSWPWVAAALGCAWLTVVFSALRWYFLLRAQQIECSLWRAIELTLVGNFFSLFAVGGVGADAAKIILLIREHRERKLAVTMTVMVDHLVGMIGLALIFFGITAVDFGSLPTQSVLGKGVLEFARVFFAGGLVMILLMFVAAYPPIHNRIHKPGREWKFDILKRLPEIYDVFRQRWQHAVLSLLMTFIMQPCYFLGFWCSAKAVGSVVGPVPVLAAMPMVDVLSALPLSIAGVGVRERAFQVLMHDLTGMGKEIAFSASMLGFLTTLFWSLIGALLFLRPRERTSLKQLKDESGESQA